MILTAKPAGRHLIPMWFCVIGFAGLTGCAQLTPPIASVPQLCRSFKIKPATPAFESCVKTQTRVVAALEAKGVKNLEFAFYAARVRNIAEAGLRKHQRLIDRYLGHVALGGTVVIKFKVDQNGAVSDAAIYRSSGDRSIDHAGLALVLLGAPYPPTPDAATFILALPIALAPRPARPDLQA